MSIWTHVVGCVRVDGTPNLGSSIKELQDALGPMCLYDDWNDESTLPRGSEGGLHYQIIEYYTGLPWVAIPIWGDLRDFSDVEAIRKWWIELLPKLKIIRDAVLHIQIEGHEPVILTGESK